MSIFDLADRTKASLNTQGRRVVSGEVLKRETPEPDFTEQPIWPQVHEFWQDTFGGSNVFSPRLAERVWVANRCIQLNAQQIASMPLRFTGSSEPAWVSNPDPAWFPNGVSDAVFAAVRNLYGHGYALLYVTGRYSTGMPHSWTVLDSGAVVPELGPDGRRRYRLNGGIGETRERFLPAEDIVQIDRNPSGGVHGTSALRAYAPQAWGLLAAGTLMQSTMQGGVPTSVIKSQRKLTGAQAQKIQAQWAEAMARRGGLPAVLPPELDFETISFSPKDLMLLDAQQFTARVVASAFGVPPFLLNLPLEGGLTYQNPEKLGEFWWRFELRPTAKRVADAFTAQMLPRGSWVTFDASDTFAPITEVSDEDDVSPVAAASPAQQTPGQVRPIRPMEVTA